MSEGIVGRILGWLRAGYPEGVPTKDYLPLLALLHRTLSEAEYAEVIRFVDEEDLDPVRVADIRAAIEQVAHVVPNEDELREVAARLAAAGAPLSASAHRLADEATAAEGDDADEAGADADATKATPEPADDTTPRLSAPRPVTDEERAVGAAPASTTETGDEPAPEGAAGG